MSKSNLNAIRDCTEVRKKWETHKTIFVLLRMQLMCDDECKMA